MRSLSQGNFIEWFFIRSGDVDLGGRAPDEWEALEQFIYDWVNHTYEDVAISRFVQIQDVARANKKPGMVKKRKSLRYALTALELDKLLVDIPAQP